MHKMLKSYIPTTEKQNYCFLCSNIDIQMRRNKAIHREKKGKHSWLMSYELLSINQLASVVASWQIGRVALGRVERSGGGVK